MGTSRRSERIKGRKKVAKGSPSKSNKAKQNDKQNEDEASRIRSEKHVEKTMTRPVGDGTKPTRGISRFGNADVVDLMNDGNEKWAGHMDKTYAEAASKAQNRKNMKKTKNVFVEAAARGLINNDESDSSGEDSDDSVKIVFERNDETFQVKANLKRTGEEQAEEADNMDDDLSDLESENAEETEQMNEDESIASKVREGRSREANRNGGSNKSNMEEGTKASRSVAFAGEDELDEDDLGLNELENADDGIMETDEEETPAGEAKELIHPDISVECRYSLIITTKPSTKPYQSLRDQLVKFFKELQNQIGNKVHVSPWDPDGSEEVPILKNPEDLPKLTALSRTIYAAYFNAYPNPKRNEETTYFWRVRLTTEEPNDLPVPLKEIGQSIYDESEEGLGVALGRNPYPCQAVKTTTLGWLFGSTKTISSSTFIPALRTKLKIPDHVCFGVQWRTLKNEHKKQYVWDHDNHPPQAIHMEIDYEYANRFFNEAAKIFKKKSNKRVLGMRLRIVPCTTSERARAMTPIQKENVLLMAAKQQYLTNSHISRIETNHILNLDRPVGRLKTTLRKYLMSRAPKKSVVKRIFLTVDAAWKGKGHVLITTKPHHQEAMELLNNMIPECVHCYGMAAAQTWFSNTGLEAYRDVKWDPKTKSNTSNRDQESISLVAEDLFDLGTAWKVDAPILQKKPNREENFVRNTVQEALDKRYDDSDVRSFGSIMGRSHEGDTIASVKPTGNQDQPLDTTTTIQFEGIETIELEQNNNNENESMAGTSAAFTTDSIRARLKDKEEENEQIRKEYAALAARVNGPTLDDTESVGTAKTTQSTREKYNALTKANEKTQSELAEKDQELQELRRMLNQYQANTSAASDHNKQDNHSEPAEDPVATHKAPANEEQAATSAEGGGKG